MSRRAAVDPIELTRELVSIPSPTGEEGPVATFLAGRLEQLGYRVSRQAVSPGRFNIYAHRGAPLVVFSTHLDTVPPELPIRDDGACLYGRGTADAKGIAAVQVAAAESLGPRHQDLTALLFVVGEEQTADGARAAAELEPKGRCVVNGEPTDNRMALGTKGLLRLELRAHGRSAHSAYPEQGDSAISHMLDALERVRRVPLPVDAVLGESTLNIGTLAGGVRANVIPDACRAEVAVRTVGPSGDVLAAIRQAAGPRVEVVLVLDSPPVRLRALSGLPTTVVR
ncbi:MAG TPA: M20/M25/M40 family metallo-hydrolase, partial [Gemmatimonadales bacterium]|nr:M20/M25/M40 family metallo-hydrolase [Gemmatimonadales bacterium]